MIIVTVLNGLVVGRGTVHQEGATITAPIDGAAYVIDDTSQVDIGWKCTLVTDGDFTVPEFSPPLTVTLSTPTPPQFLLLFTSAERVALRAARATDPVLQDFFYLIEDPRLHDVDLNLKSVQDAIMYLLAATKLYDGGGVAARHAQVLSNTPQ